MLQCLAAWGSNQPPTTPPPSFYIQSQICTKHGRSTDIYEFCQFAWFFQWNWLAAKQKFFLVNSLVTASVNIGPSRSTLEKCNICKSINVNESAILSAINLLKIWHARQQPTSLISVGFHGLICSKIRNFNACFPTPETAPKTAYLSSSSNSGRQWTPPKELIVYRLFYFIRWNLNTVLRGFFYT